MASQPSSHLSMKSGLINLVWIVSYSLLKPFRTNILPNAQTRLRRPDYGTSDHGDLFRVWVGTEKLPGSVPPRSLACSLARLVMVDTEDHRRVRTLHNMVSGIAIVLGFRARVQDPYVYVVFEAPTEGLFTRSHPFDAAGCPGSGMSPITSTAQCTSDRHPWIQDTRGLLKLLKCEDMFVGSSGVAGSIRGARRVISGKLWQIFLFSTCSSLRWKLRIRGSKYFRRPLAQFQETEPYLTTRTCHRELSVQLAEEAPRRFQLHLKINEVRLFQHVQFYLYQLYQYRHMYTCMYDVHIYIYIIHMYVYLCTYSKDLRPRRLWSPKFQKK